MKRLPAVIPTPTAIGREALTVIAGAVLAAFIVSQLPPVKAYIKRSWG